MSRDLSKFKFVKNTSKKPIFNNERPANTGHVGGQYKQREALERTPEGIDGHALSKIVLLRKKHDVLIHQGPSGPPPTIPTPFPILELTEGTHSIALRHPDSFSRHPRLSSSSRS